MSGRLAVCALKSFLRQALDIHQGIQTKPHLHPQLQLFFSPVLTMLRSRNTSSLSLRNVCWQCRRTLLNQRRSFASLPTTSPTPHNHTFRPRTPFCNDSRHFSVQCLQLRSYETESTSQTIQSDSVATEQLFPTGSSPIREQLRIWQEEFGRPSEQNLALFGRYEAKSAEQFKSRPQVGQIGEQVTEPLEVEDENDPDLETIHLWLQPGDVAELRYAFISVIDLHL